MFNAIKHASRRNAQPDPVKQVAKQLRRLGKTLAAQIDHVATEAGAHAVELNSSLRSTTRSVQAAHQRLQGHATEIADVAKELADDLRRQLHHVLR
jgi:ElaB/YqjD/DUF883 family membrane-anchored ribosome-binding protein